MAGKVRAKFVVQRTGKERGWDKGKQLHSVVLNAVGNTSDPESEDAKFWAATPNGKVELLTVNPEAAAAFEVGQAFYVEFIPVEE